MKRTLIIATIAALAAGCCARTPHVEEPRWSRVASELGKFSLPPGWDVRIRQSPMPVLDLYSPDPELAVFALPTSRAAGEGAMSSDLSFQLRNIGAPDAFVPQSLEDGILYGEKTVEPGRVFAACVVIRPETRPVMAIARLMDRGSVSTASFRAAGGRTMLCEIAESISFVSRGPLEPSTLRP